VSATSFLISLSAHFSLLIRESSRKIDAEEAKSEADTSKGLEVLKAT